LLAASRRAVPSPRAARLGLGLGLGDNAAMSHENVAIMRQILDAFNSEDIERILAFAHRDIEVSIPPQVSAEPDVYRGHDGMRRYFQSFQHAMDEIRFEAERLWDRGAYVVLALRLTARGRQTAILVEQRSAGVWTFRDGKVIGVRSYATPEEALDAVAQSEETERQT
jgi:ketosteroid isomerase-like protein